MKRCPNCNQFFSDEIIFCLNDGTSLLDLSNTGQPPTVSFAPETPTLVVPRQTANIPASSGIPGWLYAVLGAMAAIIIALGAAFFITRTPAEKETAKAEPVKANESVSNANQPNTENKTNEPTTNKSTSTVFSTPRPKPSINPNFNPSGRWTGDWTSSKAHYTAVVVLSDSGGGKFGGEIYWTLQRHTNPQKSYKAGATATEYVQGNFNPSTRTIFLSGYRKDDPDNIVVLDKYSLVLGENNLSLGGGSKSNGRFNLSR
jgi:hypothetical protein